MAEKKINVGIWGLGRAGFAMHVKELIGISDKFEIVAGCDIDPKPLEVFSAKCPNAKTYLDGDAFLADENIELITVAVRSTQHIDYAIRALEAGKYVVVEKPLGLTIQAVEKLAKKAEQYPGKLFVRHNRRYEPAFNHVREIMQSGILGDVFEIKLCRHSYQFRNDWQAIIDCGGGQLNNWGPHIIDHAIQLLESPVDSLWSNLKNVTALGDAEDHLKLVFKGKNGRIVDLEISGGVALPGPVFAVYGTRGSLITEDQLDIKLKYLDPEFKTPKRGTAVRGTPPSSAGFGGTTAPEWIRKTIMVKPSNGRNCDQIYNDVFMAIRHNKTYPITLEEAMEVVRWTEQAKLQNPEFGLKEDVFGVKTLA